MPHNKLITVICGLKSEAVAVREAVRGAGLRIEISGADAGRAYSLARMACADGASAVVSVGVSGGLDPALRPGDLVIGAAVIGADGPVYASDPDLIAVITAVHARENRNPDNEKVSPQRRGDKLNRHRLKPIFGADEIIDSVSKKAVLFSRYGAAAVDMESHGAARAAHEAGVPFIAIRAIADPAGRALPPAALNAVAPDGSTKVMTTLAAAMRDPRQLPALMKLGGDSAAALKTLRRDLGPLFSRLFLALDL